MLGRFVLSALVLAFCACGGTADRPSNPNDAGVQGALLPWAEGNSWTYRVTKDGEVTMKVVTIGPQEAVGGSGPNKDKLAHRVTTMKGATDETLSWQALEGERVVRYREQAFGAKTGLVKLEEHWDPHKLHVDGSAAHRTPGAQWVEAYEETKIPSDAPATAAAARDQWLVDGEQEVTVPLGTFRAIVLRKTGDTSAKTYWYVPGIGKVKEAGGQVEELVSFEVAP